MAKVLETVSAAQTIDRRGKLSYREFTEEYANLPGKPVILTNEMDNWKAKHTWTLEFFKEQYGSMTVTVRHSKSRDGDRYEVELGEYIDYLLDPEKEDDPLYLADWDFSKDLPELLNDYTVPDVFKSHLKRVPRVLFPPLRWFYIGPATSGTGLHVDIAMTSAWNAVFTGRKRWVFFSPDQTPHMYNGEVNAFDPDLEKYPLFAKAKPIYGIQNPGEIMFTPSGWWHQVINEEDCLSITENFINETNSKVSWGPYSRRVAHYQKEMIKYFFSRFKKE